MSDLHECKFEIEISDTAGNAIAFTDDEAKAVMTVAEWINGPWTQASSTYQSMTFGSNPVTMTVEGFVEVYTDEEADQYAEMLADIALHLCPKAGWATVTVDECNTDFGVSGSCERSRSEYVPNDELVECIEQTLKATTTVECVVCAASGEWWETAVELEGAMDAESATKKAIEQVKADLADTHVSHIFALVPEITYPEE